MRAVGVRSGREGLISSTSVRRHRRLDARAGNVRWPPLDVDGLQACELEGDGDGIALNVGSAEVVSELP
jgi:hypothetical protein